MANPHQPGADQSHAEHAEPNYIGVFVALLILTLIEVGITYLPIPKVAIIGGLLAFSFAKAALVALYFMHLRFDPRLLSALFVVPLFLGSVLIYFLAT